MFQRSEQVQVIKVYLKAGADARAANSRNWRILMFASFPFLPRSILTSSRFSTCSHEAAGLLDKLFASSSSSSLCLTWKQHQQDGDQHSLSSRFFH